MEMLVQLRRAENPQRHDYPKDLSAWCIMFLKYVQALRSLEEAHSHMVQPQKRKDLRRASNCCLGRLVEIRNLMVVLNKGLLFMCMEPAVASLGLTPDMTEIPIPTCFLEGRTQELEERATKLKMLTEASEAPLQALQPAAVAQQENLADVPAGPSEDAAPSDVPPSVVVAPQNQHDQQEAQAPEELQSVQMPRMSAYLPRKSTYRPRSTTLKPIKEQQRYAGGLSTEEAATRIQSALRGFTSRRTVERSEAREQIFLGMQPRPSAGDKEPTAVDAAAAAARKTSQGQMQHMYMDSLVSQRSELVLVEGMAIREALQEKINDWIVNRAAEDGQLPRFPSEAEGGSKSFLEPITPVQGAPLAEKGKGNKPGRPASGAMKGKDPPKRTGNASGLGPAELPVEIGHACADDLSTAIQDWQNRWADRDEPGAGAWAAQQLDRELLKAEVRPFVVEEIRLQTDEEMRMLLANLKDMADAELAASGGNKAKGKPKDGNGQKKAPAKAPASTPPKEKGKDKAQKAAPEKNRKDLTADRTLESLYAELAAAQLVQACPAVRLGEFLGAPDLVTRGLNPGDVEFEPSLADIRATLTALCILPLASSYVHDRVAAARSVLLYGARGAGKTMLTHAIAHESGACLLNLSPRQCDGKFQGKAACSFMVHMVFKVAKAMAPSVIYVDEADKVFIMDKRKAEEQGGIEPFNRIKRDLITEISALAPTDRVLVIGTSSEPFNCKRKDEAAFISAFDKHIHVPLPDYASRQVLWSGLMAKHGMPLHKSFDMSTIVTMSEGYSAGAMEQVLGSILADRQESKKDSKAPVTAEDVLQKLRNMDAPPSVEAASELKEWKTHTPVYKAIMEGGKDETANKDQGKKAAPKKKA